MHSLNNTPIFLEFLKRFFKFVKIEFSNKYIQNKLFIYSKCNCKDKGCATVYLKSRTPWKESVQGIYIFDTNKGMFIIHVEENGFLEFEALLYEQYPYKKEIDTFLKYEKAIHDSFPRQKKSIKSLTKKNKQMLHKYFRNLEHKHMNTIDLGEV